MPFFEDSFLMHMSCKNQKIYSLSDKGLIELRFFSPIEKRNGQRKRASFCTLKRASLTVESAIIIPLFFMIVVCMANIMGIYSETVEKMADLRNKAEISASAVVSDKEIWIELPETVSFTPCFLPEGIGAVNIGCAGNVRAWTGRNSNFSADNSLSGEHQYVYVTENASVYHTSSSCTHIDLSISSISYDMVAYARNENGGKYKSCEKCAEGSHAYGNVYITKHGDRYHASASCSGLKRTVRLVDRTKISGLTECSRCISARQ